MNTKTHNVYRPQTSAALSDMQAAELDWWTRYLAGANAVPRMYSLYGIRYGDWFWDEFQKAGDVVEYGSGPLPVFALIKGTSFLACDTLAEEYRRAGLMATAIPYESSAAQIASETADTALLLNVLDHASDPQSLVQEAHRALRSGGKALVFVHLDAGGDDKHRTVTMADAWGWLIDTGFEIERDWLKPATQYDPRAFLAVAVKR